MTAYHYRQSVSLRGSDGSQPGINEETVSHLYPIKSDLNPKTANCSDLLSQKRMPYGAIVL
jgi:hypothetical protein